MTSSEPIEISLCRDAGSCQGRCGGGSDVDCWCDDLCHQYGDCCCDLDSSCQSGQDFLSSPLEETCSEAGSCAGRCDDGSDGDCWCDHHCQYHGDCCCDRLTFCPQNITTSPPEIIFTADTTTVASTTLPGPTTVASTTVLEDSSSSEITTSRSECWCSTTEEGPVKGECCVFPFLYKSESHHSCVEVEDGRAWCSTAVDSQGGYLPGQWGYCGEDCFFDTPTPPVGG